MGQINSFTQEDYLFVNFEDMQRIIKENANGNSKRSRIYLINTLPVENQHILIQSTIPASEENEFVNQLIQTAIEDVEFADNTSIVLYGKNDQDRTAYDKHHKLVNSGFKYVYIYSGGLFEWLLLNELYGRDEFPIVNERGDVISDAQPMRYYAYRAPSNGILDEQRILRAN